MEKIVVLGADHNGVKAKRKIREFLQQAGYFPIDIGPFADTTSYDYVDFAQTVGMIIQNQEAPLGILICGTGVGMSIVANKYPGVRAALVHNRESAVKSKEHNDSNILCLGAWINSDEENLELIRLWLSTKFGEYRHVKRIERIGPNPRNKVVFTNGCFDLLHAGHISLLRFAKNLGDYLVVGLNSDRSVAEWKGVDRPITREGDRKAILEAVRWVDEVIIFDEPDPKSLIRVLNPHIIVRGGDYTADEIRKRDEVPEHIDIKICPLFRNMHTSKIIEQVQSIGKE